MLNFCVFLVGAYIFGLLIKNEIVELAIAEIQDSATLNSSHTTIRYLVW